MVLIKLFFPLLLLELLCVLPLPTGGNIAHCSNQKKLPHKKGILNVNGLLTWNGKVFSLFFLGAFRARFLVLL